MAGVSQMKKILFSLACALLFLTSCSPAGSTTSQPLVHLRLAMGYQPDVQFAPIYTAIEKGYFAAEGFDVELIYQDENLSAQLVGADELQFAIVSGEQVPLARAQGLPVVYVAAWYQQYPVSIVSAADLNIETPSDLRGRTIGLPFLFGANYIGLRALLYAGGLQESDVTLETIGYGQVDAFTAGRNPIIVGYIASEPIKLRALGYNLTELRVADYVQLASNGLITNEKTISGNPDTVQRMVTALLHGIADTLADPETAYQISLNYVEGLTADDPVQKQVLATSIELWQADRLGYSNPQAWENMQTVLLDMGLLTQPLDLTKAFTNEFVP